MRPDATSLRERGQVIVVFALLLPVFFGFSAVVIGLGNWFVHGKHLQTKADAGAFAGGAAWGFPCGAEIDARIAAEARLYSGANNPQVGGVPNANVHTALNAASWYDDDEPANRPPVEFNSPAGPVCASSTLDVKVTEDNSFPLASLIPLFPDIKRRARVEIQETESQTGLLPIAMRAPVPLSVAAYYNEATGNILARKYFVKAATGAISGLPANLQGWTTANTEDASTWAQFVPTTSTGVVIAISFRGACNTNLPSPNTKIPVQASGPCFEDEFSSISQLCNQGSTQVANCYYATGNYPSESVQAGLHFIRGYQDASPGVNAPAVESAYLENVGCVAGAYYNWQRTSSSGTDCDVRLNVSVDTGTLVGEYGPPGPVGNGPLRAQDVEVRFRLVRADGSFQCNYGNQCDLTSSGTGPTFTYATNGTGSSPHLQVANDSQQNAVALQIRLQNVANAADTDCANTSFNNNCRWFYTGSPGPFGTSVAPTNVQILAAPVQRSFRGNTVNSSSVQWLQLTTDSDCNGSANFIAGEAASQPTGGNRCFQMEMGLKGGLAQDADETPIIFNDGVATSKTGILDCDPAVPQGQAPIESVEKGCAPWYAPHSFDTSVYNPLCPDANDIFDAPNPGAPWTDWPPLTCIKTRSTSTANQLSTGFENRFFNGGTTCPADGANFVKGRNYWNVANNPLNAANANPALRYGFKDDTPVRDANFHPGDPRLVTIFLVPTYAIISNGSVRTYPIAGFVQIYITGFGRLNGSGNLTNDDPCPGNTPPPASEYACGGSDCGTIAWGHILNWVVPSPGATGSGVLCDPGDSLQPCVPVLVE